MFRTGDRWEADMVGPVSHKYYGTAGCAVLLYKTPGFPETIIVSEQRERKYPDISKIVPKVYGKDRMRLIFSLALCMWPSLWQDKKGRICGY